MWHYLINDQQHGPVSEQELLDLLAKQIVTPQTSIWRTGMRNWIKLETVDFQPQKVDTAPSTALDNAVPEGSHRCAFSGVVAEEADMFKFDGHWVANDQREAAEQWVKGGGWLPSRQSGCRPIGDVSPPHLFTSAWKLLSSCALPAFALFLIIHLPLDWILNQLLLPYNTLPKPTINDVPVNAMLLTLVFNALVTGGLLYLFRQHSRGDKVGFQRAAIAALGFWLPLVIATLAASVAIMTGTMLFIVPGVVIGIRCSFALPSIVERRLGIMDAFKHSWQITSGYFALVLGFTLVVFLGCLLPSLVVEGVLDSIITSIGKSIAPNSNLALVHSIVGTFLNLPSLYISACLYTLYKELEARYLAASGEHN